jgi:hypothetical protein
MHSPVYCPICSGAANEVIHKVVDGVAVTSDSNYSTSLDPYLCFCIVCSYWFTRQGRPLDKYYADEYTLLMQEFHVDQLLQFKGRQVNRAEYQAGLIQRVARELGSRRLLEVGAGKGLTAYHVMQTIRPQSIVLHDPAARRYAPVWGEQIKPAAIHDHLEELQTVGFDLAFTFFTLEHTERPKADMALLAAAMRGGALFIGVVPWLCANAGDLLVGDHCSHFTKVSLSRLLEENRQATGIEYRVLINYPLRGLVYICSRSIEHLNRAASALQCDDLAPDFGVQDQIRETADHELLAVANRHWRVEADALGERREVLWGAGFYSKLIMLRHKARAYSLCIDSNPSLVGTCFTDPSGRAVEVSDSVSWLAHTGVKDRLWLGVSASARELILTANGRALARAGVEVAF